MKLRFAALLALMASSGICRSARAQIDKLEVLYDGLAPAVVTITSRYSENKRGVGTGVVVHKDGFVVTAAHVIDGAKSIQAHFKDGKKRKGRIVTLSRTEDLALIQLEKMPKLDYIPQLGDSDLLEVGQPVFMIGTPLGLTHTVTEGIISSLRKTQKQAFMKTPYVPERLIQTDAAMNQGNSGGAVFNADGQVVGIASFIASPSGGSVGLGFAIPSNAVRRRLFDQALPYIGVSLRRIPKELAAIFHWPTGALLIERVDEDSAAAKAGLRGGVIEAKLGALTLKLGGDLIMQVGGIEPKHSKKVHAYLHGLKEGDSIDYVVMRAGKLYNVKVPITELIELPKLEAPTRYKKRKPKFKRRR